MARKGFERISQREYARRLGISNEAVSKAVRDGRIKKGWSDKEQKIIVEHADREFGLLFRKTNVSQLISNEAGPGARSFEETAAPPQNQKNALSLDGNSSYGDARRVKEIMQAQLVALDLKERKGELVQKEEVFKQLYSFGQNIRISLLAIPDRVIDNIIASKTRAEAHNILVSAIHEQLEKLTDTGNLNFQGTA